jgi:hypothetical protein
MVFARKLLVLQLKVWVVSAPEAFGKLQSIKAHIGFFCSPDT